MQEPDQRFSTEEDTSPSQAFTKEQPFIERMQEHTEQEKIYPPDTSKRIRVIVGIVLSSLGIAIFLNGIPFSAIGIELNAHNPTMLTWSVLGLVFSILFLLVSAGGVVISTLTLLRFKKHRLR